MTQPNQSLEHDVACLPEVELNELILGAVLQHKTGSLCNHPPSLINFDILQILNFLCGCKSKILNTTTKQIVYVEHQCHLLTSFS